jgi:nucleoside-diphosphate-sugar epimerase
VVYVTTGLPYKLSIWRAQWPTVIDNVIGACRQAGAKLVFIDNIYSYGPSPLNNPITEEHPTPACIRKGQDTTATGYKIRRSNEKWRRSFDCAFARIFMAPNVNSSSVTMAIDAAVKGKKAYFMGNPETRHTYSYVPDIAKATVMIARSNDAFNQTWHVPSAPAITGTELMNLAESALATKVKWSMLRSSNITIPSLFVPILREFKEMMYQFENDYIFDSSKFQKHFPDFKITSYPEGIKATVEASRAVK